MKTSTTISRWKGVEPPDILPLRRQIAYLFWEWRWVTLQLWLAVMMRRVARYMVSLIALGALCLLLLHSATLLRYIDPTAAVIDVGALSLVLLAVIAVAIFLAVSSWLIGLLFPVLRAYQKHFFSNNFKSLSPWQKITFYLIIFFGLLYAFVVCLVAVF